MDTRSAGGVLLAFAGIVLLIAGFRGTLGKTKDALFGAADSGGATQYNPPPSDGGAGSGGSFSVPMIGDYIAAGINDAHPGLTGGALADLTPAVRVALAGLPAGYAGTGNVAVNGFPAKVQA